MYLSLYVDGECLLSAVVGHWSTELIILLCVPYCWSSWSTGLISWYAIVGGIHY